MKALLFLSVLISLAGSCLAQISDNFSDLSLTNNPTWFGDTTDFIVNEQSQLQLKADSAGTSTIYLSTNLDPGSLFWAIDCQLDFDPSLGNQLNLYLGIDTPDLSASNGFLVQLGESASEDKLRLYQIHQGEKELLATGVTSYGMSPRFRIEIKKTDTSWILSTTISDTAMKQIELDYLHALPDIANSGYFGLSCTYTESRKDLFVFDNLIISNDLAPDLTPPMIESIEVSQIDQIIVQFSEPIDAISASNKSNFKIIPSANVPVSSLLLADPTLVQIDLGQDLVAGVEHLLAVMNVTDIAGNIVEDSARFKYLPAITIDPYDIVFNEIFDDPTPVLGLPEAEYIELYIRKDGLNLGEITLTIGDKLVALPNIYVNNGDYLVIHDADETDRFKDIPGSVAIDKLPALINSGSTLTLKGPGGKLIDVVSYDDNWYTSSQKSEGGWALESINPDNPCALAENWTASTSLSGGTPGRPNSVLDFDHLGSEPMVVNLVPIDSLSLSLSLNKSYLTEIQPNLFEFEPSGNITQVSLSGPNGNEFILALDNPLQKGVQYQLSLSALKDCSGRPIKTDPLLISIPEKISPGDLVINEILFDPHPGGEDFVELYNRSAKALLLSDINIGNSSNSQVVRINRPYLILPGAYVTLSPNPINLQKTYRVFRPDWLIQTDLPSFSNDAGNVTIYTNRGTVPEIIDAFDYSEDMHHSLLREREGVSLERLDPENPTRSAANWHSAAQSADFATPTSINSQYFDRAVLSGENWQVSPKIFSPDGDGFNDYTLLNYKNINPGTFAHIKIFDAGGRMVRYLANNQFLATEGSIQWDGTTDAGTKTSIGIYTIYIQIFDLNGKVTDLKETCVVAARLN
ncbi:MAG: lamin tail domain-containing protein [Saprospiraceae bacterium]|nr:lamin tail domain-containing protein [Saprospiraceae bacterium]